MIHKGENGKANTVYELCNSLGLAPRVFMRERESLSQAIYV